MCLFKRKSITFMDRIFILSGDLAFEVAQSDLSENLEWIEAKTACSKLGDRWRLPTKEELTEMHRLHVKAIGNFTLDRYWSATGMSNYVAFRINFMNGRGTDSASKEAIKCKIRPVRSI